MINNIDEIYSTSKTINDFAAKYIIYLTSVLSRIDTGKVDHFVKLMLDARNEGKKIIFIGNGGSAATASHFANDIGIGTRCSWKPFKALSLTDNVPVITAIGNDFGYEYIFTKQLEGLLEQGDILVAISASGNSQNLLNAIDYAKKRGNKTVGIIGFSGGKMREICDLTVLVETPVGEYGPVEDAHMVLDHLIMNYLSRKVQEER